MIIGNIQEKIKPANDCKWNNLQNKKKQRDEWEVKKIKEKKIKRKELKNWKKLNTYFIVNFMFFMINYNYFIIKRKEKKTHTHTHRTLVIKLYKFNYKNEYKT